MNELKLHYAYIAVSISRSSCETSLFPLDHPAPHTCTYGNTSGEQTKLESMSLLTTLMIAASSLLVVVEASTVPTDSSWNPSLGVSSKWSGAMATSGRLALLDLQGFYNRENILRIPTSRAYLPLPFRGGTTAAGVYLPGSSPGTMTAINGNVVNNENTMSEKDEHDDVSYRPQLSVSAEFSLAEENSASAITVEEEDTESSEEYDSSATALDSRSSSEGPTIVPIGDGDEQKRDDDSRKYPMVQDESIPVTRKGAATVRAVSLPARILVTIWASWNLLNGALLTFTPKDSTGTSLAYFVEAIGVVRMSQGLQLLLVSVADVMPKRAMGAAVLTRLGVLVSSLMRGTYEALQIQSKRPFLLSAAIMSATSFCLLSDKGRPMLMAYIFSAVTFIKALKMMIHPDAAISKLFGMDTAAATLESRLPGKCQSLGFHLIISAVYMNALSCGKNPIKAAGYSAAAWFALLVQLTFSAYGRLSDIPTTYLFFLASALTCSVIFLTGEQRQQRKLDMRSATQ